MSLLIVTQKVDEEDDLLGFFHRWIKEFAKNFEKVTVICLWEGKHNLPQNVSVYSLGKESGAAKLVWVKRFFGYVWKFRSEYSAVFVHMNPEYLVLAGWLWGLMGKPAYLWYTHRQVNLKLRIAHMFVRKVFSASGFSFRLPSSKLKVVGHGIDVEQFGCSSVKTPIDEVTVLSVGSLRPIKHQEVLIKAASILRDNLDRKIVVRLIGQASPGENEYEEKLHKLVKEEKLEDIVVFVGSVPNKDMSSYYCRADVTVNMTPDGGIDKAVLESMAAGIPTISSNHAFVEHFGKYADMLIFDEGDYEALSERIVGLLECDDVLSISEYMKQTARESFSVEKLIGDLTIEMA